MCNLAAEASCFGIFRIHMYRIKISDNTCEIVNIRA